MEQYMTTAELAKRLNVAEATVRRWVLRRKVPFHKVQRAVRFRASEVEKWIERGDAAEKSGRAEPELFAGAGSMNEAKETGEQDNDRD